MNHEDLVFTCVALGILSMVGASVGIAAIDSYWNNAFHRYHSALLNSINEVIKADGFGPWGSTWRYERLKEYRNAYYKLRTWKIWRTWRNPASFFPDKTFMEPLPEYVKEAYRALERSTKSEPSPNPSDAYFSEGGSFPVPQQPIFQMTVEGNGRRW